MVPILDIAEHADNIQLMNLDLPGIPIEDVRVDVPRLQRAMHWGGIRFLTLGSYEGDSTEYTASGVQQNWDGTLSLTGEKIAKKASVTEPQSQRLERDEDYRWRNTAVYFNAIALQEMSGQDPSLLTTVLDRSFRKTILKEVADHEVGLSNITSEVAEAIVLAGIGSLVLNRIGQDAAGFVEWFESFVFPKIWFPAGLRMQRMLPMYRQKELPPKYSLMFSFKFDRALLATRHLVAHKIITLASA